MNSTQTPTTVLIDGAEYRTGRMNGALVVLDECSRCGGTGSYPSSAYQGVCLLCSGAQGTWRSYDEMVKRVTRRAKDTVTRAARAEVKRAAEVAKAISNADLFLADAHDAHLVLASDHHIAIDILAKLRQYGSVSEAQWALAVKVSTEAIERDARYAAEKITAQAAGHLANVGDKVEVEVTIVRVSSFETQSFNGFSMETKYVIAMVTAEGHELNTFTNGAFVDAAEVGAKLTIKATVKKHDEYQGKPQTTLIRVKSI